MPEFVLQSVVVSNFKSSVNEIIKLAGDLETRFVSPVNSVLIHENL